ncbi:MAG: anti-sigma factor antagonist [Chitinivibrionales bacterium]|nr:anti-sigma factor antagonist [Chitinivibrionales bacterium]
MNMVMVTLLIVGSIALISVVIGIFNILQLSATSLAIHKLQSEIEKKAHEFEFRKKEALLAAAAEPTPSSQPPHEHLVRNTVSAPTLFMQPSTLPPAGTPPPPVGRSIHNPSPNMLPNQLQPSAAVPNVEKIRHVAEPIQQPHIQNNAPLVINILQPAHVPPVQKPVSENSPDTYGFIYPPTEEVSAGGNSSYPTLPLTLPIGEPTEETAHAAQGIVPPGEEILYPMQSQPVPPTSQASHSLNESQSDQIPETIPPPTPQMPAIPVTRSSGGINLAPEQESMESEEMTVTLSSRDLMQQQESNFQDETVQTHKEQASSVDQDDIMDIVEEQDEETISAVDGIGSSQPTETAGEVTAGAESDHELFHVYSESKKDADFAQLWTAINRTIAMQGTPHIVIDFSNIDYLYESELFNLKNLLSTLLSRGGVLSFVNCSPDLTSVMSGTAELANIIR